MRLRNVPGAREVMIENEFVFTEPENMAGTWKEVFGNNNPVRIEIGMGKGRFITTLAQMNPDINYIGIEKYSSVLLRAVENNVVKLYPAPNNAVVIFQTLPYSKKVDYIEVD